MTTWTEVLTQQKSYTITELIPNTQYTLSINGMSDGTIEAYLGGTKIGEFVDNRITFTPSQPHTTLTIKTFGDLFLANIKLEKGNVAHKWTPAPEDKSIPKIRFFEYVKIISKPHEIDDSMLIKKQTIHLDDPSQNTIEVGVEVSSFTDKQLEANNTIKKINSDYITNDKLANVVNPLNIQISTILQESNLIKLSVERLNSKTDNLLFDSILVNANGELDNYKDWKDFASNDGVIVFDGIKVLENMTSTTLFEILKDSNVLGGTKLSFFGNGKQEYGLRPIVDGYEYSYRAKRVKGTQPRTVEINEYDSNQVYLRKRSFIFDGTDRYEDIPNLSFGSDVKFISITYVISGVSVSNRLEIAETMFAIGDPKPYVKSADSVANWAQSEFKMLSDEISLKVDVDGVVSAINLSANKIDGARVDITGTASFNDNVVIKPDGTIKAISGEFENANITGNLNAGKISNMDFDGTGITFPNGNLKLDSSKNAITAGALMLRYNGDGQGDGFEFLREGDSLPVNIYGSGLIEAFKIAGLENPSNQRQELHIETITLYVGASEFGAVNVLNGTLRNEIRSQNNQVYGDLTTNSIKPRESSKPSYNIGSSNFRYYSIYLAQQPNVSSDIRHKFAIQDIPEDLLIQFENIEPKMYLQGTQWHFGYIAQDVERALYKWATNKYGLEAKHYVDKFAILHKDESLLSLLYGEIAVIKDRQNSKKIKALEERLEVLENGNRH